MHHVHPKRRCISINLNADTSAKKSCLYNKPSDYGKPRCTKGVGISPETLAPVSIDFFYGATDPSGLAPPPYWGFTITLRHTHTHTLGRTPLEGWSVRRGDLYLTTHNIHQRQTYMARARFEPAIPTTERPQTHCLDWAATWIGFYLSIRRQLPDKHNICEKSWHWDSLVIFYGGCWNPWF
jgi:hypothetical protein